MSRQRIIIASTLVFVALTYLIAAGPREADWKAVQDAISQGLPKTAIEMKPFIEQFRARIIACVLISSWLPLGGFVAAQEQERIRNAKAPFSKTVHLFKTVDGVKLQADVYRHDDVTARGVIVWLHGGALIMGTRAGVPKQLRDLAQESGFVLVSLDYRLAPQAQLPEIIEDLKDGLEWVRQSGPELFHADASRIAVAGASAGGYLALMSGIVSDPPPLAIVSYWGFGDVDGDWTTKPSDAYRKGKLIAKEAAWAGVGEKVLTATNQQNGRGRSTFFLYLKQTGRWINAVGGFDPETDTEQINPFCPVRNVSANFPPTLFLHGTADIDVPVGQSIAMAEALKRHGVEQELITIEGGGHSLWGGDPKQIDQAFERSAEYIRERLSKR